MANQIALGIDVDSTDVKSGEAAFARLKAQLKATQAEMDRLAKSSGHTDAELRRAAKSQSAFDAASRAAASQTARLNGALASTATLARAVQAAFAGFLAAGFVRSLMNTTMQLQKIDMTFQAVTGSSEAARGQMAYVSRTADMLGQSILTSAQGYARLLAASDASGISLEATRNIFEGLTAAGTAFSLSQEEVSGALLAVQQIISKGRVQAEELTGQLGERLPGAFAIAATSMGMTVAELTKQMALGNVSAEKFVNAFGPELQRRFMDFATNAQTSVRAVNELDNAMLKLRKAVIQSGFESALVKVLEMLTGIAASQEAVAAANALGAAFGWMAQNGEVAAMAIGLIVAAITPFGGVAAIIAGALAALMLFSQRTFEVAGEQVKVATIIAEAWGRVRDTAQAVGTNILQIWGAVGQGIGDITRNFAPVMEAWAKVFRAVEEEAKSRAEGIREKFAWLYNAAVDIFSKFGNIFNSVVSAFNGFINATAEFVAGVASKFSWLWDAIRAVLDKIVGALKTVLGAGLSGLATGADLLGFEQMATGIRALDDGLTSLGGTARVAFDAVKDSVVGTIDQATDGLQKIGAATADAVSATGTAISASVTDVGTAVNSIGTAVNANMAALTAFGNSYGSILAAAAAQTRVARQDAAADAQLIAKATKDAAAAAETTADAMEKTGKNTKKALTEAEKLAKKYKEQLFKNALAIEHKWNDIADSIANAMQAMGTGGDFKENAGGLIKTLSDALFGETMKEAYQEVGDNLAKAIRGAIENKVGFLSGPQAQMYAGVGMGIAGAAIGAMNEDAASIGSGLGAAAGAVLGSFIPGIGTALGSAIGSVIGGFLANGLGGGSKFEKMRGVAFEGTTFQASVRTENEQDTTNKNLQLQGRLAYQGTKDLLADFNAELAEFVTSIGGEVARGTALIVDQASALRNITGVVSEHDIKAGGVEGKQAGERIQAKVQEIMAIAGLIVQKVEPPLTQAQNLWREAQEKFSATNVAILEDLGFSIREITHAQLRVQNDIINAFNRETVNMLVDTGRATKVELDQWKAIELQALQERRAQAIATAREIGANVDLVNASFRGQRAEIVNQWREMLGDMVGAVVEVKEHVPKITNMDQWGFADSILAQLVTINDGAAASARIVQRWYDIQVRILENHRQAAIAEATRLGVSTLYVQMLYDEQLIQLNKKKNDMLIGQEKEHIAKITNMDRWSFADSILDELTTINDGAAAGANIVKRWYDVQLRIIEHNRQAAIAEAVRLGVSTLYVQQLYNQQIVQLAGQRDALLLRRARETAQAEAQIVSEKIGALNDRMTDLVSQRSSVLQELTQRSNEARDAERALADARAGMAASTLAPGGPLDVFNTLKAQFTSAVGRAKGGDTEAAGEAASLAQRLLESGRGIFASSTQYTDLFANVNRQLLTAQSAFDREGDKIDKVLDNETFAEITEKNTGALLKALGSLDVTVRNVQGAIDNQTARLERLQQRAQVA